MKRHCIIAPVLFASMLFVFAGCDTSVIFTGSKVSFTAGASSDNYQTKVSYGNVEGTSGSRTQPIYWTAGDRIKVYCAQCDGIRSAEYEVAQVHPSGTSSASYARIDNVGASGLIWGTGRHTFYAVYPSTATISGKDVSGNIPSSQSFGAVTGTDDKVVPPVMTNLYMTARTEADAGQAAAGDAFLGFQTLSTVLEFTITNKFEDTRSSMIVSSISLISDNHKLSGDFTADLDVTTGTYYGRPEVSLGSTTTNKVTIDLSLSGSPVTIAYGKTLTFTFFLNPGNATEVNDITFEIKGQNGGSLSDFTRTAKLEDKYGTGYTFPTHKKTNISGILVPESVGWNIEGDVSVVPWDETTERNPTFNKSRALQGEFTVNTTSGKKVHFSIGNLYYDNPASGTPSFKFEDSQTATVSSWDATHVTLFRWAKKTNTLATDVSSAISTTCTGSSLSGGSGDIFFTNDNLTIPRADFTVEGLTGVWRTLSKSEVEVLFNSRAATTLNGTANARFCRARINTAPSGSTADYTNGVILFPDVYSHPSDVTLPTSINSKSANFSVNTYSSEDWTKMESAGCVFLLCKGHREGTSISTGFSAYQTSSPHSSEGVKCLNLRIESSDIVFFSDGGYRDYGRSVRLVRDAE